MLQMSDIHEVNPYYDFSRHHYPPDLDGWHGNDLIFHELIKSVQPKLIIEVGSWKGQSAVNMASYVKTHNMPSKIVCVDTWLGAGEFWDNHKDQQRYGSLRLLNGYPRVYYTFLSNVIENNVQDVIIPFPQTSSIAARFFTKRGVRADLIYIDASHETEDVRRDIADYYFLLNPGGVIFGDDFDWETVKNGVAAAAKDMNLHVQECGVFWKIEKAREL